jgi:hypothetical protein
MVRTITAEMIRKTVMRQSSFWRLDFLRAMYSMTSNSDPAARAAVTDYNFPIRLLSNKNERYVTVRRDRVVF